MSILQVSFVRVPKAQSTLLYDTLPVLHGMFYNEKDRIIMRRIALLWELLFITVFITKTKTYNFKESILCRPQYHEYSTIDFWAFQQLQPASWMTP